MKFAQNMWFCKAKFGGLLKESTWNHDSELILEGYCITNLLSLYFTMHKKKTFGQFHSYLSLNQKENRNCQTWTHIISIFTRVRNLLFHLNLSISLLNNANNLIYLNFHVKSTDTYCSCPCYWPLLLDILPFCSRVYMYKETWAISTWSR
jgi:hypothetical protein